MTNKEIIKALECCGKNHISGSTDACEHCFLQNRAMCVTELIYKTLDLINRQQSAIDVYMQENDRLKTAYIQVSEDRNEIRKETEAEIENLKENNKAIMQTIADVHTEAIKEFAERLKKHLKGNEGWK